MTFENEVRIHFEDEERIRFMIQCCKLEIRRLNLQLSLTYSPEERSEIELRIKKEQEELRQYEMEQDF